MNAIRSNSIRWLASVLLTAMFVSTAMLRSVHDHGHPGGGPEEAVHTGCYGHCHSAEARLPHDDRGGQSSPEPSDNHDQDCAVCRFLAESPVHVPQVALLLTSRTATLAPTLDSGRDVDPIRLAYASRGPPRAV